LSFLSAKNELTHICAEVTTTGEDPPSLDDVISMLFEDITNEALPSSVSDGTGRRLKNTHRRSMRAHHLQHNRFVRPRRLANERRLDDDADPTNNLIDALSITGGYNGVELYIRLELDVSKLVISSIDDLVKQPFSHLENVEFLTKLFAPASDSIGEEPALNTSVSFSAGAHVSIRGAYINAFQPCPAIFSDMSYLLHAFFV